MNKTYIFLLALILLISCSPKTTQPQETEIQPRAEIPQGPAVNNYEECVQAGYPIQEKKISIECLANGRTFAKLKDHCKTSQDCPTGFDCTEQVCKEVIPQDTCQTNTDCLLINKNHEFGCCWTGACEPIDYSSRKWVAVNRNWFETEREKKCPFPAECGPAPMCASRSINTNYEARCTQGKCQKIPTAPPSCQNLCEDGECQETVCQGSTCPCAENTQNCPEDCE